MEITSHLTHLSCFDGISCKRVFVVPHEKPAPVNITETRSLIGEDDGHQIGLVLGPADEGRCKRPILS